jgi:hypothetical protein
MNCGTAVNDRSFHSEPWTVGPRHFRLESAPLASGSPPHSVQAEQHDALHPHVTKPCLPRQPGSRICRFHQRRPGLRSGDRTEYRLPRCRRALGKRAFSFAGPLTWNKLRPTLRDITDLKQFRKTSKTHIFLELSVVINAKIYQVYSKVHWSLIKVTEIRQQIFVCYFSHLIILTNTREIAHRPMR